MRVDDGAAPILDDDGQLLGAVMVFRDVSRRRRAERALGAAYQELEAAPLHKTTRPFQPARKLQEIEYAL